MAFATMTTSMCPTICIRTHTTYLRARTEIGTILHMRTHISRIHIILYCTLPSLYHAYTPYYPDIRGHISPRPHHTSNCGCGFDAGDCCGKSGQASQYQYCTECECLDPKVTTTTLAHACGRTQFKGNGFCDDDNNVKACAWDGGDCCESNKKATQFSYCHKCECRNPEYEGKGDACVNKIKGVCGAKEFVGDGFCDDNNNVAGCAWDNGDCCGYSGQAKQFGYCTACKCLDCTVESGTGACLGACAKPSWKGDGNCDDDNNNCGCGWDAGDCCGANVKKTYCKVVRGGRIYIDDETD